MPQRSTTDQRRDLIGSTQTRECRIETRAIDEDARTVELAFSSETPVSRWWGEEVLGHDSGEVRLDRMRDGAPLLLDHRSGQQIGVIESARIDKDKVGRALVRFSRGPLGDEIFTDVRDGIRSKVSVGYQIHELRMESSGDDGDTYRITDWEPLEASIVSIPADASVGVGRSADQPSQRTDPMPDHPAPTETPVKEPEIIRSAPAPEPVTDPEPEPAPVAAAPINPEADAIRAVGQHFNRRDEAENHIMLGGTLQEFRDNLRKQMPDPVPVAPRIEASIPGTNRRLRSFRPDLYGSVREAGEAAYRAGMWARAMMARDPEAQRWCRDHGVQMETRVMTGLAAGQSAVVPEELMTPIIDLRLTYGVARSICSVEPMMSDTATVPRRSSGVTAYFVGRETATTASDAAFDNIQLTAREVSALTRISNSYLADSVINLADHLAGEMALAFATKEDSCLIDGDGTSTYGGIVGLRTLLNAAGGLAGAVDAPSGLDTFGEITDAALHSVMGVLPDFPGINPIWLVHKTGAYNMFGRLMAAAGGNTKQTAAIQMPGQYSGYDIRTSNAMPSSTGDLSDVAMALFGDFSMGVVFGDRMGMEVQVLTERYAEYRQTGIIATERFDINCHGVGTTAAAGPIVALVGE